MPRRETPKVLHEIAKNGGKFLPCPQRKNRAIVDVRICQCNCRFARKCKVFAAWQRPMFSIFLAELN